MYRLGLVYGKFVYGELLITRMKYTFSFYIIIFIGFIATSMQKLYLQLGCYTAIVVSII